MNAKHNNETFVCCSELHAMQCIALLNDISFAILIYISVQAYCLHCSFSYFFVCVRSTERLCVNINTICRENIILSDTYDINARFYRGNFSWHRTEDNIAVGLTLFAVTFAFVKITVSPFYAFRKIFVIHQMQACSPNFNSYDDLLQTPDALPLLRCVVSFELITHSLRCS